MVLTLCPNCRLPVNTSLQRCPQCGVARRIPPATSRQVSVAAVVAVVATAVALVTRRVAT
jgi:hypothetical protein